MVQEVSRLEAKIRNLQTQIDELEDRIESLISNEGTDDIGSPNQPVVLYILDPDNSRVAGKLTFDSQAVPVTVRVESTRRD